MLHWDLGRGNRSYGQAGRSVEIFSSTGFLLHGHVELCMGGGFGKIMEKGPSGIGPRKNPPP